MLLVLSDEESPDLTKLYSSAQKITSPVTSDNCEVTPTIVLTYDLLCYLCESHIRQ